tara:strand:- start:8447 stop:9880 length:1434 start_codon:yes stop_codon:yes gene_type:complete
MPIINCNIPTFLLILFCINLNANSQTANNHREFSKKELTEDLNLLKEILLDAHPGIFWYNNQSSLDSTFNQVLGSLNEDETEIEFYRKALGLVAQINCGHTWLNASNSLSDSLWNNIDDFPMKVKIVNQRLYYTGSDIPNSISSGDEILAINGHSSQELIRRMINYSTGDGFIKTGRIRMVERTFGFYYALLYGFNKDYKVRYVTNNKSEGIAKLSPKKIVRVTKNETPIQFSYMEGSQTGILKITTFSNEQINQNEQFQSKLRDIFVSLKNYKAENLIVDLRENRGGSDELGLLLLSYLVPDSVVEFNKMYLRTIDSELLKKYSDLMPDIYERLPRLTREINDTTFLFFDEITLKPFPPSKPFFGGRIFILINGNTFSTAADVSAILYSKRRATFIGEETGGGYYGNTSGIITQVTLPNTGFQLQLPLVRYETNVKNTLPIGSGVKPDFLFSLSKKELFSEKDVLLEYSLNLINEN